MGEDNNSGQQAKFCRICGERLQDNAKFCPKCGSMIEQDNKSTENNVNPVSNSIPVNNANPANNGNFSNSRPPVDEKYPGKYGSPDIKSGNKTPIVILIVIVIVAFLGLVIFGGVMAVKGISSLQEKIESTEKHNSHDDDEDKKSNKKDDDVQTVEKEDPTDSSEEGTDSVSDISDTGDLSEAEVSNMLDRFVDWCGIRMMYTCEDYSGIDVQNALPLTLFYMTHGDARNDYMDGDELKISEEDIEDKMMEIFGQSYDADDYVENSDDYMVHKQSDGYFTLTSGDWGETYPKYDILSITEGSDEGTYIVETEYYMWSDPDNDKMYDNNTLYVDYVCKKDKSAPNGFYITDMTAMCFVYDNSSSSTTSTAGYSDSELTDMAKNYYEMKNGEVPPYVEIEDDPSEEGKVMIRLYEIVDDHTATWDWYIVDRTTGRGEDVIGNEVDLTDAL